MTPALPSAPTAPPTPPSAPPAPPTPSPPILRAWQAPPDYSPAILADLFPASILFAAGSRYPTTRAVLTAPPSPRLFVFVDSPVGPAARIVAEYDPDNLYGALNSGFDVLITAPHQTLVSIRPESGCGCGSRLRTMRPFNAQRHTTLPALPPLPAPQFLFASLSPDPAAPATSPRPTSPPAAGSHIT